MARSTVEQKLREIQPTRNIKILMISRELLSKEHQKCYDFLRKNALSIPGHMENVPVTEAFLTLQSNRRSPSLSLNENLRFMEHLVDPTSKEELFICEGIGLVHSKRPRNYLGKVCRDFHRFTSAAIPKWFSSVPYLKRYFTEMMEETGLTDELEAWKAFSNMFFVFYRDPKHPYVFKEPKKKADKKPQRKNQKKSAPVKEESEDDSEEVLDEEEEESGYEEVEVGRGGSIHEVEVEQQQAQPQPQPLSHDFCSSHESLKVEAPTPVAYAYGTLEFSISQPESPNLRHFEDSMQEHFTYEAGPGFFSEDFSEGTGVQELLAGLGNTYCCMMEI